MLIGVGGGGERKKQRKECAACIDLFHLLVLS